jgi:hypothetical protein
MRFLSAESLILPLAVSFALLTEVRCALQPYQLQSC